MFARRRRRALGEKQDSDGNYSSSGVCCKRLAKISAKKRINVTGGKRKRERERNRKIDRDRERGGGSSLLIFLSDNCRGDN